MSKRLPGSQETVDSAIHLLHQLQSEGWVLSALKQRVEYASPTKKGVRLPLGCTVTIQLEPLKN